MNDQPVLTEAHYSLFGQVMSLYARAEVLLRAALGSMLDIGPEATSLLTAPYTTAVLRDAVKAACRETLHRNPAVHDALVALIDRHASLARFRNDIAHATWGHGRTEFAVRPIAASIRSGRLSATGYQAGDRDYSTAEMTRLQNLAVQMNADLHSLLISDEFEQALVRKSAVRDFYRTNDEGR